MKALGAKEEVNIEEMEASEAITELITPLTEDSQEGPSKGLSSLIRFS
jgi:hypothetical protein